MRVPISVKSTLLTAVFLFSSCATTKYSDDISKNNYTNLQAGKIYSFQLKNSTKKQKMVFNSIKNDSIIGFKNRNDSTRIALAKSNVVAVTDKQTSNITTAAITIGTLGAAALILSSTRATRNEK